MSNQTYMTKINKSDVLEYHSLTKNNDTKAKENSVSKIEKQMAPKNLSNKSFIPNQKLTKKLNETGNKKELYLTTEIIKNNFTTKHSPLKTIAIRNQSNVLNTNKVNNTSLHKSVLVKEEIKKDNLEYIIAEFEKFNNIVSKTQKFEFFEFDKLFQIFDQIGANMSLDENKKIAGYSQIWKSFLQNLEKIFYFKSTSKEAVKHIPKTNKELSNSKTKQTIHAYNNISHLNNNNFNFQIVDASNLEFEKLKKNLMDKEKEIKDLKSLLEKRDKKIKEIEKSKISIKEKPNLKNNYMSHNIGENLNIEADKDQEELICYQNKQLLRDYKNLCSENKNFRDVISQLEKDIKACKEKEIKIMHILYSLNKKGVLAENLLSEEFPKELADLNLNFKASRKVSENIETSRSLDNSMYTPICIDSPPCFFKKPDKIPLLNLNNINNLYNKDFLSPSKMKEKKNMNKTVDKKEKILNKEIDKEYVKDITFNKLELYFIS